MIMNHGFNIIELPKLSSDSGDLTFVESNNHIPFTFKRIFNLYNIRGDKNRGAHAHKKLHQFIIASSGQFNLIIDDGTKKNNITMNKPEIGIHIKPMIWLDLNNFTDDAVCTVLASEYYEESDYIRDYQEFLNELKI